MRRDLANAGQVGGHLGRGNSLQMCDKPEEAWGDYSAITWHVGPHAAILSCGEGVEGESSWTSGGKTWIL